MKKINRNFFKPFMFICVGLMAVVLMSATVPYTTPGKPENVKIVDWGAGTCTIGFTKPVDDGGAPITSYIVEKRDVQGGRWVECAEDIFYEITVDNLIPGREYEFRVSAVNKAGQGMPSEPTKPFVARDK